MLKSRWLLAVLMIAIGALQAWDSHALQAERFVQAMVGIGTLLPAAALLWSTSVAVRFASVLASSALMIGSRMASEVRLPELALAAFFPAIVLWLDTFNARRAACAGPR